MKKKTIIFADTVKESAAALVFALGETDFNVIGICASGGRVSPETAAQNALCILQYLKQDILVYKGASEAIVADMDPLRKKMALKAGDWRAFEQLQLDMPDFPAEYASTTQAEPAALWVINTLKNAEEPINIITLGPLTDLALALRISPEITRSIGEIIISGGGHQHTDISSSAEYNIFCDPEAAAVVVGCAAKKTILPLDCAFSAGISMRELHGTLTGNSKYEKLILAFLEESGKGNCELLLPSLLAVCFAKDRKVLRDVLPYRVDVDYAGGIGDGETIFDTRRIFGNYNCETSFSADKSSILEVLKKWGIEVCNSRNKDEKVGAFG